MNVIEGGHWIEKCSGIPVGSVAKRIVGAGSRTMINNNCYTNPIPVRCKQVDEHLAINPLAFELKKFVKWTAVQNV